MGTVSQSVRSQGSGVRCSTFAKATADMQESGVSYQ